MKIAVIGTGFVGVVTAAVYASFGHQVWGLDIDEQKIAKLKKNTVPFFEPNLEDLLRTTQKKQFLHFTSSYKEAIADSDCIVVAVGTPSRSDGSVNLDYLHTAITSLIKYIKTGVVIAIKSTVPPGTLRDLSKQIQKLTSTPFQLASLPEFLKEGSAVQDTLHPDRVVIGASSQASFELLAELHASLDAPIVRVSPESAQMAKYAANAYLATRITFINQVADLCVGSGANIDEVVSAMGYDQRIGHHYWYPGLGYGGSCFPKDVKELAHFASDMGKSDNLFAKISQLNEQRLENLFADYDQLVGGFKDKKVAVLGLAFKPQTDDLREAPSLKFIPKLIKLGAHVIAHDPVANQQAKQYFSLQIAAGKLEIKESVLEAAKNSDVIILLTEWPEFSSFDYTQVRRTHSKQWVIDTRNRLDATKLIKLGFIYRGVGK